MNRASERVVIEREEFRVNLALERGQRLGRPGFHSSVLTGPVEGQQRRKRKDETPKRNGAGQRPQTGARLRTGQTCDARKHLAQSCKLAVDEGSFREHRMIVCGDGGRSGDPNSRAAGLQQMRSRQDDHITPLEKTRPHVSKEQPALRVLRGKALSYACPALALVDESVSRDSVIVVAATREERRTRFDIGLVAVGPTAALPAFSLVVSLEEHFSTQITAPIN
ncbi:hypothetical protein BJ170DRAFT_589471 [Xylariales sp. AK1849]|nr:hypothetical protein BJ170DRAFT_589471 [Xylariales sp. AK1849]